jgi:hypothetical protein
MSPPGPEEDVLFVFEPMERLPLDFGVVLAAVLFG